MSTVLYRDPDLGPIFAPKVCEDQISFAGRPTHIKTALREVGIFVTKLHRSVWGYAGETHQHDQYCNIVTCWVMQLQAAGIKVEVLRQDLIWSDISYNERVDIGAAIQANRVFGTTGTTANGVFTALAIASASLTKTKTDLSLGSASANVTTNEFTTIGLSRAAATVSTYTAPASLGATFSQLLTKAMSVTGTGTAQGCGVFDQVTVSGSNLYVEDNYSNGSASVANGDTLTSNATISN